MASVCLSLTTFVSAEESVVVRRAAFDFGSGSIKMQVADVDLQSKKVIHTYLKTTILVPFQDDLLSKSGRKEFSVELIQKALTAAKDLKQQAQAFGASEFSAFATEAFRIAENSSELFDLLKSDLQIPVHLVSQQEEGLLGIQTASILSNSDPEKIVVWDIGAGSFQITLQEDSEVVVMKAPWGVLPVQKLISSVQGKDPFQSAAINPLGKIEFEKTVSFLLEKLPSLSDSVIQKLSKEDTVLVGIGAHPNFVRVDGEVYSVESLEKAILENLGKSEMELNNQTTSGSFIMSDCILVYAAMKLYGFDGIKYIRTGSGNALAVLVNPIYWE